MNDIVNFLKSTKVIANKPLLGDFSALYQILLTDNRAWMCEWFAGDANIRVSSEQAIESAILLCSWSHIGWLLPRRYAYLLIVYY